MSTIQVANISDGTDTVGTTYVVKGSPRQSVSYNQATVVINASVNTSSVTDFATGQFEPQFINNFADVNYIGSGLVESTATSSFDRVLQMIDINNDKTTDGVQYMTTGGNAVNDYASGTSVQGFLA